jgi:hypothetical protein
MSLLNTDQSVSSFSGVGMFTKLASVKGNILVDSGTQFPAGREVQSLFQSVPASTALAGALDTGNATLVAGTVTVADTNVTANSVIQLTYKTIGGTAGILLYTTSAGVGFTITSSSNTDTSVVSWLRIN